MLIVILFGIGYYFYFIDLLMFYSYDKLFSNKKIIN